MESHGKTVKKRRPLFQYIPLIPYPSPEISSGKRDCFFYIYCVEVQDPVLRDFRFHNFSSTVSA